MHTGLGAGPALWEEHTWSADVLSGVKPSCVRAYPSAPDPYDIQRLIARQRKDPVVLLLYDVALTKAIDAGRICPVQN